MEETFVERESLLEPLRPTLTLLMLADAMTRGRFDIR